MVLGLTLHFITQGPRCHPPTSLLLTCGLLHWRVASPRWVNWVWRTWPPSGSLMWSLLLWPGADVVVCKSTWLCSDFKVQCTCHSSTNTLDLHTQTPQLSFLYHICHFTRDTSVCFVPKQGHSPTEPPHSPERGNHCGFHIITQTTGPLELLPPAPLCEISYSIRIRFSSSATAPETFPYLHNPDGFKEHRWLQSGWALWMAYVSGVVFSVHPRGDMHQSFIFSLWLNIVTFTT